MAKETKKADYQSAEHANLIKKAIAAGLELVGQGKPKVEAAMAMYRLIHELPQDEVVKAFTEGALLTDKGALTYWYNCRRRYAREQREAAN